MNDDDLDDLKVVFLDECRENIALLERGLMAMSDGEHDADRLNEVFRAAHSIKGGAATFGYTAMSELTHHMETLLDEMRAARRPVVEADTDLLFEGLDTLQRLLEASALAADADDPERARVQSGLQASVQRDAVPVAPAVEPDQRPLRALTIAFEPHRDFHARGHEPLLILQELQRLGEVRTSVSVEAAPGLFDIDLSRCWLSWQVQIDTHATDEALAEIFAWVDTDCSVTITARGESASEPPPPDARETPVERKPAPRPAAAESASIRIATDKIDELIDLVGELVITQSMLSRVADSGLAMDAEEMRERVADLEQHTRQLQESVMQVRMLPLSSAFARLPRMVRDLSRKLDKAVDLRIVGESTELDKTVLERIADPLVHLVRNALDHGVESRAERAAAGKPAQATLALAARQENGSVIIEISDDGGGIDEARVLSIAHDKGLVAADDVLDSEQIQQLIFAPGFSTAETVTDTSGRGVGMDVVRRNILDLGGRVHVASVAGQGTRIEITLPLSLAIMDGQLVRIDGQVFVIPILSIVETLEIEKAAVSSVPGIGEICRFRGEYLPMIRAGERFGMQRGQGRDDRLVVVVETHGGRCGVVIEAVLGQQQVVIKPLDKNYRDVEGLGGATIMSDGSVALIIDPASFVCTPAVAVAA